jgi:glucose-6-phosphate isomerase
VEKFGIAPESMFEFWDWVGGRYSLWSAVGLSALVALGADRFQALLAGAHAMDEHFRATPLERNMPVILGLLAAWNINFLGATSQVVIPYAQRLDRFVGWLQQLEMESNGKRIDRLGQPVDYATTPPLWGDVGTNAQHAFFQMLHQGSSVHPVDFILPLAGDAALPELQRMLIANCLAQSAALMAGKSTDTVTAELRATGRDDATVRALAPHRSFPGDRPSNTLLLPRLDPFHLGALLALYEHRTFVESVIWNINAFDQWGVELGKQIAGRVLGALDGGGAADLDASTQALLRRVSRPQAVPDPDQR